MDINTVFVLAVLGIAGMGFIWRLTDKEGHERFKNEAPGAFLTSLSRRLK
jgi:hypothetical protein